MTILIDDLKSSVATEILIKVRKISPSPLCYIPVSAGLELAGEA